MIYYSLIPIWFTGSDCFLALSEIKIFSESGNLNPVGLDSKRLKKQKDFF